MMFYENFTLAELTESETAREKNIRNEPSEEEIAHLGELTGAILQPLRKAWGGPIRITSGYRSKALNKAVGGVAKSAHLYGFAADTQPGDMADIDRYITFVREWLRVNNIAYDQCIVETSSSTRWVHIAVRDGEGRQRRQTFNMNV